MYTLSKIEMIIKKTLKLSTKKNLTESQRIEYVEVINIKNIFLFFFSKSSETNFKWFKW